MLDHLSSGIYLFMQLFEELNLIHQRLDLPLQLQARQSGIIHVLVLDQSTISKQFINPQTGKQMLLSWLDNTQQLVGCIW